MMLVTVTLPAATERVRVGDIPRLVADAVHPSLPGETARFVSYLQKEALTKELQLQWCGPHGSFPISLSNDELQELNRTVWPDLPALSAGSNAEGPAKLSTKVSEHHWPAYQAKFDASPPGDWRLSPVWRNPVFEQWLEHHQAQDEWKSLIAASAATGELEARTNTSIIPRGRLVGRQLEDSFLTISELTAFLERYSVGVEIQRAEIVPPTGALLLLRIAGREALPVRAIPYVTGWGWSPDEVAKQLARLVGGGFAKLDNTTAYQVRDGQVAKVLPKEWERYGAALDGLEAELREAFPNEARGYAAWQERSAAILPAGVFVWRDEFEADYRRYVSKVLFPVEREGDRELTFSPVLEPQLRTLVLEGFANGSEPQFAVARATKADKPPRFEIPLCPREVPSDLKGLPRDARVHYINPPMCGRTGEGFGSAGDLVDEISKTIARQAAGWLTLEEAAQLLEDAGKGSAVGTSGWCEKLANAALAEELPMHSAETLGRIRYGLRAVETGLDRVPGGISYLAQRRVDSYYDWAHVDDLNKWLEENEPRLAFVFDSPAKPVATVAPTEPDEQRVVPAIAPAPPKPVQRQAAQEEAILAKLRELGFDPTGLPKPPNGRHSPAKQAVKQALKYSHDVFNKAWQRLRSTGRIAYG